MAFEVELWIIMVFSIVTAVLVSMFALSKKKRYPWSMFALFILLIGFFASVTLFAPDLFGLSPDGRIIPIDALSGPLLAWILGLVLLAKANHDVRLEKQNEKTLALNEISRAYLTSTSIADAAKSALDRLVRVFEAESGVFFLMDTTSRNVSLIAASGETPKALLAQIQKYTAEFDNFCLALASWLSGDRLPVRRLMQESMDLLKKEGYSTALGAPVISGQIVLGMVLICSRKKLPVTEEDREHLNLVAFQLGLWMSQMMNIEKMKRLAETQKALLDVSLLFQLELDVEKISHSIISKLIELIPARDVMVYLYDDRKKTLRAADAIGKDAEAIMAEGTFPLSEAGLAGHILMSGKPEIIPDTLADGRGKQIEGTARESTAMLALPLISKGKPLGIIEIHRDLPATFTEEELKIGALFAQQASIALENAQLLQMMENEKDRSKLYLDLLSHDIANLNTPLYSYFDLLLNSDLPDETKDLLRKAHAQVEAMSALVSRVRKLSKGDLEDMEEVKTVMVRDVIKDAIRSLKGAFPNKEIEVNLEIPENEPFPARAGEMLDEIFLNILHNSVKFSKGKKVRIDVTIERMEIKGRWFCAVRIADYGCGVPDEMKEEIFSGRKAVAASFARGFGIGLNMCRKLVEKYGGSIWVEDRVRGDHTKGACFVVTLPTMPPKQKT
jgi:signal transduction histidine kinase